MDRVLKSRIVFMMFLLFGVPLFSFSAFASHPLYPSFSSPENGFLFNNASGLVSVSDTTIYKTGYYSVNGSAWVGFNLSGSSNYNGAVDWLNGSGSKSLPVFGFGEHYVIVYSCTYNISAGLWDCHEGKWQLVILNNSPVIFNNSPENCSDGIKNQNEVFTDCGGNCSACECLVSQSASCNITNGVGSQSRNCTDGRYDSWGLCIVTSCNTGYVPSGNLCVENSTQEYEWTGELLVNPGFELGDLTGWTISTSGWNVGVHVPSTTGGDGNVPKEGNYCAFSISSSSAGYIYQDVSLSEYAQYIDVGTVLINASGWKVSAEDYCDNGRIQIIFLNSSKGTILTALDTGYGLNKTWSKAGIYNYPVPKNTRYVRVWGNTYETSYDSGSLDSFSVKVKAGPCTDTCASLGYNCESVCGFTCGSYGGGCQSGYYCSAGHCTACTTHSYSNCSNGDVYWYNSCGEREGIRYDCNSTQTCSNGQCVNNPVTPPQTGAIIADHTVIDDFDRIPSCWIEAAKDMFRVTYHHTSHGSQIPTGMYYLSEEVDSSLSYGTWGGSDTLYFNDNWDTDLGNGNWPDVTVYDLEHDSSLNSAMWSWCGQVLDYPTYSAMSSHYLAPAENLVDDEGINFIYMTGHLDGGGPSGDVYVANNIIRQHVQDIDGVLFDFADIESYDPAGNYYPYGGDACEWCDDWCNNHPSDCLNLEIMGDCAHSHQFNCLQKAKAFWWMMARMAGWDGVSTTCG